MESYGRFGFQYSLRPMNLQPSPGHVSSRRIRGFTFDQQQIGFPEFAHLLTCPECRDVLRRFLQDTPVENLQKAPEPTELN